jgi:hypothetical protein
MEENITENIILDFNSALDILNKVSKTFNVEAWIPSTSSYLTFKELDAKQQKSLLNAAMDTTVYNTGFIKAFYNILKENVLTEGDNLIDSLTLSDKACIALTLRSQISDEINVIFDEKKDISEKIKVKGILDDFKNHYKAPNSVVLDVKSDSFSLKVEVLPPTIKTEVDYDNQLKSKTKSEDVKTEEDVRNIVTDAFLGETSKFINKIWVNEEEITLSNLKFDERIKLVEKLPSNILQKIIENISSWKKDLDDILTVKHEEYVKTISIDSLLFLN